MTVVRMAAQEADISRASSEQLTFSRTLFFPGSRRSIHIEIPRSRLRAMKDVN
jgi:hypothetical protein